MSVFVRLLSLVPSPVLWLISLSTLRPAYFRQVTFLPAEPTYGFLVSAHGCQVVLPASVAYDRAEEAVLSDEQMMTIAERIACYDWQRVGISLDIPYTQLESLRKEHSTNPSAAVMAMLTKWLERGRKSQG